MFEALRDFTETLPVVAQWLAVVLLGTIPFVESYLGAFIGVLAGMSPFVAIPAAIVGNVVSMVLCVYLAETARARLQRNKAEPEMTPRRAKLKARFDRYGVPGVSLLGPLVLASQITSAATVSFGASRQAVIVWQTIAITLWGIAYGALAALGIDLFVS